MSTRDERNVCHYLATPLYISACGLYAVTGEPARGYRGGYVVRHIPSGVIVPAAAPPRVRVVHPSATGKLVDGSTSHFRVKTAARAYMDALSAAALLPDDPEPTREQARAVGAWIESEATA